ncbi:MAG TPA: isopentenyl-diphosphate Delta-isomerase [Chitinophagaceae bacterium]|nr:isopentenyl-diphosphate Delta-isomerase [Chitinophagaceae bacterium]
MVIHDIILVNEQDEPVGTMEKMEVHRKALLHRAFSIFIFNSRGEMLLQQRSLRKYHSAGLWTNACCSHPKPGEDTLPAAETRLQYEMGFGTVLTKIFEFTYRSVFDNGLTEYEFDHVYAGLYDGIISPAKEEVNDYCFKSVGAVKESLQSHPSKYTTWLAIAFPLIEKWMEEQSIIKKVA